jgi:Right handed beta helix region
VHDVLPNTCNSDGGSGINLNGTNAEVVGNYVHNIGPYPSSCEFVQGIYFLQPGGYAYNNIAFNNSGFGIQMWHYPANLAIFNNTVFANAAGGIVLGTDDTGVNVNNITVANNIVMDNTNGAGISEQGYSGHNTFKNNLVYGNSDGAYSLQNGDTATGTVTANPQFVGYTGNNAGNYHLQSGSAAIGAGLSSGAPSTDFDGNPRGSAVDIGAYQH